MPPQKEFHLQISGPELERDFVIPLGETLIGREPSVALPLVYPLVSRRHARLDCSEDDCTITDLESANGTIINGVRINPNEPVPLADGMHITIGPFEIVVAWQEGGAEAPAPPPEEQPAVENQPAAEKPAVEAPASAAPVKAAQQPVAEAAPAEESQPAKKAPRPAKPRPAAEKPAAEPPVVPPVQPPAPPEEQPTNGAKPQPIPGLSLNSQRLINFLPGIYNTDFMSRFLGLFESILTPIEWNVDNFDMFLDPGTSPFDFLPWLAGWYEIVFDVTWSESQRRTLLGEAAHIYARRGTRWALCRLVEIYTGSLPEIVEFSDPKDPFTFTLKLSLRERDVNRQLLEALIDHNKPAHSSYVLEFRS